MSADPTMPSDVDHQPILSLVDPDIPTSELSLDELGSRIVGLSGRLAAAMCRWLLLVADFDARDGAARFGLPTTARWLSLTCGIARRTAIEHVRVARALTTYPVLAESMNAGRLSYSHVRAITRAACDDDPELVADLVEMAEHSAVGQLETMIRGLRTVQRNEADEEPHEYFGHDWTAECQWRCHARLDPERGALVQSALEAVARVNRISLAKALVHVCEAALVAIRDSDDPPRPLRGHERAAILVHLDAAAVSGSHADASALAEPGGAADDTLRSTERSDRDVPAQAVPDVEAHPRPDDRGAGRIDGPDPGGHIGDQRLRSRERTRPYARLANGPGLPGAVVDRLLCDGRIRTVVHDRAGNVGSLGRAHRIVSERQYRALLLRDLGCCTHPGCGSTSRLEAHHVRHWIHGGTTDLPNLVLLCERHHHAHHDGEFTIQALGSGRFRFLRADGLVLEPHVDPSRLAGASRRLEDERGTVADDAATTKWNGDHLDHHWAIGAFVHRRRIRAAQRTAPERIRALAGFDPWALTPPALAG